MSTGLCRSALVSAGLQGCSTPCFLQCSMCGKHWVPGTGRAASSHPWAKSNALNRGRRTEKVRTELPFLQTCWGCKGGRASAMDGWMEGLVHLNVGICAFKCRIGELNAVLRGTLRTCLLWPKLELALPGICALPGALPLQASLTHQQ